ncbi:hypothetical protein CASFOL_012733 [Castilleja foliolosa]|uniref:Uncharacterized protein n=1 Tax=Castilleja foliolosa TaxID=1961234 RepID=A0ABD3DI27_9LAMI
MKMFFGMFFGLQFASLQTSFLSANSGFLDNASLPRQRFASN